MEMDGIRVQSPRRAASKSLQPRRRDVSAAFPDIIEAIDFDGVFDASFGAREEAVARSTTAAAAQPQVVTPRC